MPNLRVTCPDQMLEVSDIECPDGFDARFACRDEMLVVIHSATANTVTAGSGEGGAGFHLVENDDLHPLNNALLNEACRQI